MSLDPNSFKGFLFDLATMLTVRNTILRGHLALVSAFLGKLPLMENIGQQDSPIREIRSEGLCALRPVVTARWDPGKSRGRGGR